MPIPAVLSVNSSKTDSPYQRRLKLTTNVSAGSTLSYRDKPKVHVDSLYVFQPDRVSSNLVDRVRPKP